MQKSPFTQRNSRQYRSCTIWNPLYRRADFGSPGRPRSCGSKAASATTTTLPPGGNFSLPLCSQFSGAFGMLQPVCVRRDLLCSEGILTPGQQAGGTAEAIVCQEGLARSRPGAHRTSLPYCRTNLVRTRCSCGRWKVRHWCRFPSSGS